LFKHKDRDLPTAFENASKELGISFIVYKASDQIYSSRSEFFQTGLFSLKLNPLVHYNLNYLSYREFLTKEIVNNFRYDAFYKKFNSGSEPLIIGVNDAFNKIELAYSTVDFDVLLFGTYSFALLIIIVVSTFFAGQISAPIRRLTKATKAVAQGDLNVDLQNSEKGELKDLYDGFNIMTKELQKNQIEIAELERENAWKEMAKQVAHEIKNPLTPMKLAIQQLVASYGDKKEEFESVLRKLSQSVLNQIESLSQIATEFSSFAKMPSIRIESFDIISVVNDIINLFADESIEISVEYENESLTIEADQSQFKRMIINMIRNSIQAEAGRILIKVSEQNGMINLLISDNGNGISQEIQNKIFESNFTTKDKGMGLGLKLSKRFLEQIQGDIKLVHSSAGKTEFLILIPISSKTNIQPVS
ncbi:MAG TPA: ATP-binding protein, partial [Ignavibacteriaceae bacterium]